MADPIGVAIGRFYVICDTSEPKLSDGVRGIPIASSGFDANMLLKQMGSTRAGPRTATEEYA